MILILIVVLYGLSYNSDTITTTLVRQPLYSLEKARMSFEALMLGLCVLLFLIALFFLFFAIGSFFYPQSRTAVEVYPEDMRPPRRWRTIFIQTGISLTAAAASLLLFNLVFMPEISAKARADQLQDAEVITRDMFKDKIGQAPDKMVFDAEDPRNGVQQFLKLGWKLDGTAWIGSEVWDVTVTKAGIELRCEAKPRP